MSRGIRKPWIAATPEAIAEAPVSTGVYELRDEAGEVLDIAYAGTREPFGLSSGIAAAVAEIGRADLWFRFEQHVQYQSRYVELVLNHRALHDGQEPARVAARPIHVVGRISLAE
jgi:hypothetical protein